MAKKRMQLFVCGGTGCTDLNGEAVLDNLRLELEANALENDIQVIRTGCFGLCNLGPIVKVMPGDTIYTKVQPEDAKEIVEAHVIKGQKVERLLYRDNESNKVLSGSSEMSAYVKQLRIVLRNCGIIDPENIEEAIAHDAYEALGRVLSEMTPEEAIKIVKDSGLRGRGGGGFPTGVKWEIARRNKADEKYVVCNADEGDPGAFMDRSVLEGDPHSVLEAMAICGYCIEASTGLIYIRAEYPLAVARLKTAIK